VEECKELLSGLDGVDIAFGVLTPVYALPYFPFNGVLLI